jgi:lipoprotein-anchoring transpeptidase ErfK/SrfK
MLAAGQDKQQDKQVETRNTGHVGETPPAAPVMPGLIISGLAELLPRIAQREPAAVSLGWAALATNAGAAPELVAALTPQGKDFAAQLAALGADNSFLHSAEGRALATSALAAAMALPDAEAVAAGSKLISLSLRGRIDRANTQARACVDEAYRKYRVRADRWVCDPANVAGSRSYTIGDGDTLGKVASKFRREKIPVESGTLAVLNRISNENTVQVGQQIKVPVDPIYAVVEKRSFSLAVYVGDSLLRLYWIGHGADDKTPVADFTVGDKQPRPQWTAPNGDVYPYGDPRNILGEYFIKFRHPSYTGFGAHGTPMPDTICTMSSMGCIRMLAPDIQELFKILPRDARISVRASESLR